MQNEFDSQSILGYLIRIIMEVPEFTGFSGYGVVWDVGILKIFIFVRNVLKFCVV